MGWQPQDLVISLVRDMTSHPVVTISVTTPIGELIFMGEPEPEGEVLICRDVHVQWSGREQAGRPGFDGLGADRDEGVRISWTRHYGSGSHDWGQCGNSTA
jgi:hypothetical protein